MSIALPEAAGQARSTKSEPPLTAANVSLTLESVQTKIKEIEANQRLEEPRKNQLLELYRQAQSHLEAAQAHTASALAFGLSQIRIEENRSSLRGLKRVLDRLMSEGATTNLPLEEQKEIRADLRRLVKDQRELLDKLADAYTSYLWALGDLDVGQKQLVNKAQQFALFLDERLVWVPSSRPVGLATVRDLALATGWMLSPLRWAEASEALIAPALQAPILMAPVVFLFGALFWIRYRARLALGVLAARVSKPYSDRFILTVQTLGLTLLVAAPWPLLLGFLGLQLQAGAEDSAFTRAVSTALLQLAPSLFLFYTFHLLCRPKGLAELHFGWQTQALRLFRWHLPWLIMIVLPAVFVTSMAGWEAEQPYRDSLGRLAFIVSLIAFAVFLQRLLRPKGGALEAHLQQYPYGWLTRLRFLWYPTAIVLTTSKRLYRMYARSCLFRARDRKNRGKRSEREAVSITLTDRRIRSQPTQ